MDQFEMMLLQIEKHSDYYNSYNQDSNATIDLTSLHNNMNNNGIPYTEFPISEYGTHTSGVAAAHSFIGQQQPTGGFHGPDGSSGHKGNSMAAMREMIFRIAAMQPVHIDPDSVKPPKRRNVKISSDPQSVAARHRRERISERIRILQRLVPGGTKMDTASMLDEAIHYVKFLKNQVRSLERVAANRPVVAGEGMGFPVPMSSGNYFPLQAGEGFNNYNNNNNNNNQATTSQHLSDS